MNFLIIQEKGRHPGNQQFREALNLERALVHHGHKCIVWGLNYDNFSIPFKEISADADVLILLENYEANNWIPELASFNKLKLFWSIDSHCVPEAHVNTCNKHKIDVVLCAIEHHQKLFKKQKTTWFPNAYPHDLIDFIPSIKKQYDIGFCGSYLNRAEWINAIKSKYKLQEDIFVIGDKMVEAVNSYYIHFNRNIGDDINFRTFETLGCKTFLLTNATPGLDKLFSINKHLVTYKSIGDMLEKIDWYLNRKEQLQEIAENGYQHVRAHHTYYKRAEQLIDYVSKII